jgi:eukaryotic-like serine/threonine-protein kinase
MSEIHHRIEAVFNEAVSLDTAEERALFLNRACAGEPQLREEVQELLRADARAGGFLSAKDDEHSCASPPWEAVSFGELPLPVIHQYTVLRKLGEGGFGIVYLAQQEAPVRRRVALKLIKPGMDSEQVVARFQTERQALAMMEHPHIAKVLDAGATASGRLYFVMEFVQGVAITRYCEEQQVSPHGRIHLFIQVCQAVQHAHQRGIIHRDLKPSNVLVAVIDGVPAPKVIDFGVAKATQQELTDRLTSTQLHPFLGTPCYMSPEQADMTSGDIDTRTDIYSLGVLLYQLLTGVPRNFWRRVWRRCGGSFASASPSGRAPN